MRKNMTDVLDVQRRYWRLVVEGNSKEALADLSKLVRAVADKHEIELLNGTDPFAAVKPRSVRRSNGKTTKKIDDKVAPSDHARVGKASTDLD